ncbi:hypothetical protein ACFOWM_00305 [Ferruginibacter yonginensis]|uniref:GLPGLI family protein n=1 Tax=Ferruginibacter yonginensis TaxID=1310416 RepID=A0ABV8QND4_9BACT
MRFFFAFLSLFVSVAVDAQEGYCITFNKTDIPTGVYYSPSVKFVYNDSFSFLYYYNLNNDYLKDSTLYSSKLIHHAVFTNKHKMKIYYESTTIGLPIIISDTIIPSAWKKINGTRNILGYECFGVKSKNKNIEIWYAEKLGNGVGFMFKNYNLGQPMEMFDYKNGIHYIATKIERGVFGFKLPEEKIVTTKQFRKLRFKSPF